MTKFMTTLDVSDPEGEWLVMEAMRKGTTIQDVVKELIRAEMERRTPPIEDSHHTA